MTQLPSTTIDQLWATAPTLLAAADPMGEYRQFVDALDWRYRLGWLMPRTHFDQWWWFRAIMALWLDDALKFAHDDVWGRRHVTDPGWAFTEGIFSEAAAMHSVVARVRHLLDRVVPIDDEHTEVPSIYRAVDYGIAGNDMFHRQWVPHSSTDDIGWRTNVHDYRFTQRYVDFSTHNSPRPEANLDLHLRHGKREAIMAQMECEDTGARVPCLLRRRSNIDALRGALRQMNSMPDRSNRSLYAIALAADALRDADVRIGEALSAREYQPRDGEEPQDPRTLYRYDGPHVERMVHRRRIGLEQLSRDQFTYVPRWVFADDDNAARDSATSTECMEQYDRHASNGDPYATTEEYYEMLAYHDKCAEEQDERDELLMENGYRTSE